MIIRKTITYTKDDLKLACKLNFNKYNRRIKISSWLFPILGLLFAFSALWDDAIFSKLIMALGFMVSGGIYIWIRISAPTRMLKANEQMSEVAYALITDETVEAKTEGRYSTIKWYTFYDAIISEEMVMLFTNSSNFILYPRRFFSEEEYAFLKEKANKIEKRETPFKRKMSLRSLPQKQE